MTKNIQTCPILADLVVQDDERLINYRKVYCCQIAKHK